MHRPHGHNLVFRKIIITPGVQASEETETRDEGSETEPRDGLKRIGTREQKIGDKGTRDEESRREPRDRHKRRGTRKQEMRDQGQSRGT